MTSQFSTLLATTILATTLYGALNSALAGNDSTLEQSIDNWRSRAEQMVSAQGAEALVQIEADIRRQTRVKQPTLLLQLLTEMSPGPESGIAIEASERLASD